MNVPLNLKYTSDHEWVAVTGATVRVGITDYAQDALGDVVFVQLPQVGSRIEANASISEIESTKSVNDVYAPFEGVITAVNEVLNDRPELLNSDPYGDGWICEIECSQLSEVGLLDAAAYL
ncbi:MAG: glycine cleavage system protein GcvH, partial [Actinomycetota bacterium]